MYSERMFYRHRINAVFVVILLISLLLITGPQHKEKSTGPTATFIISSWDYGGSDGIRRIDMHENSSGSWVVLDASPVYWTQSSIIDVPAESNTSVRLRPYAYILPALYGLSDYDDAKAIMRLNVTVTSFGETIFSKQNLTLEGTEDADGALWYIVYEVALNFLVEEFHIYNVYLTYEIYSAPNMEVLYPNYCVNATEFVYEDSSYLDPEDYGRDVVIIGGLYGVGLEYWIAPKDFFNIEQVVYKLDFPDIENPDGDVLIKVHYKVESASNEFYYRVYYNDTTKTDSSIGTHQTFWILELDPEHKTLDYLLFYNYATPASVSSGNYSVWIDYIMIIDTDPTEQWNEITDAVLYLSVQFSSSAQWAFDAWFITAGLVMLPASTLYLAYGGRKNLTTTKFFYFLIMFIVAWGLLIGGVS